jgi:hypothetical protein
MFALIEEIGAQRLHPGSRANRTTSACGVRSRANAARRAPDKLPLRFRCAPAAAEVLRPTLHIFHHIFFRRSLDEDRNLSAASVMFDDLPSMSSS